MSIALSTLLFYNATQASTTIEENTNPLLVNTASKVNTLATCIDGFFALYVNYESIKQFMIVALEVTNVGFGNGLLQILTIGSSIIIWKTSYSIAKLINKLFFNKQIEKPNIGSAEETQFSNIRPTSEVYSQAAIIAKIGATVLLCFITGSYFLLIPNLIFESISLYNISSHKWVSFTKEINPSQYFERIGDTAIKVSIIFRSLFSKQSNEEECTICSEKGKRLYHFCADHSFSEDCILEHLSERFANLFRYNGILSRNPIIIQKENKRITFGKTMHNILDSRLSFLPLVPYFLQTKEKYTCDIEIPKENLPTCPSCRKEPLLMDFEMECSDKSKSVKVNINVV